MGGVYLAEDLSLGRPVALKVISPALASDPAAAPRFLAEARAAAALRHPNVVTIYQVGEEGGVPYLAMEYLEGETLARRCHRDGPLPVSELLQLGRQVCDALVAAHARGIVHRDLKPENLWIESRDQGSGDREEGKREEEKSGCVPSSPLPSSTDPCSVKVLDFGLAILPGKSAERLTASGIALGTPQYMSPEQARCEPLDGRSDLFSLGVTLYVAATGRLPFDGPSPVAILTALILEQPADPRTLRPDLPPALAALLLRLLDKRREGRPASAAEVGRYLDAIAAGDVELASPGSSWWRPALGAMIGGCLAGLIGLAAASVLRPRTHAPATDIRPAAAASESAHHPDDPALTPRPR